MLTKNQDMINCSICNQPFSSTSTIVKDRCSRCVREFNPNVIECICSGCQMLLICPNTCSYVTCSKCGRKQDPYTGSLYDRANKTPRQHRSPFVPNDFNEADYTKTNWLNAQYMNRYHTIKDGCKVDLIFVKFAIPITQASSLRTSDTELSIKKIRKLEQGASKLLNHDTRNATHDSPFPFPSNDKAANMDRSNGYKYVEHWVDENIILKNLTRNEINARSDLFSHPSNKEIISLNNYPEATPATPPETLMQNKQGAHEISAFEKVDVGKCLQSDQDTKCYLVGPVVSTSLIDEAKQKYFPPFYHVFTSQLQAKSMAQLLNESSDELAKQLTASSKERQIIPELYSRVGILTLPTKAIAENIRARGITSRMLYAFATDHQDWTPLDHGEWKTKMIELLHEAANKFLTIYMSKGSTVKSVTEGMAFFMEARPPYRININLCKEYMEVISLNEVSADLDMLDFAPGSPITLIFKRFDLFELHMLLSLFRCPNNEWQLFKWCQRFNPILHQAYNYYKFHIKSENYSLFSSGASFLHVTLLSLYFLQWKSKDIFASYDFILTAIRTLVHYFMLNRSDRLYFTPLTDIVCDICSRHLEKVNQIEVQADLFNVRKFQAIVKCLDCISDGIKAIEDSFHLHRDAIERFKTIIRVSVKQFTKRQIEVKMSSMEQMKVTTAIDPLPLSEKIATLKCVQPTTELSSESSSRSSCDNPKNIITNSRNVHQMQHTQQTHNLPNLRALDYISDLVNDTHEQEDLESKSDTKLLEEDTFLENRRCGFVKCTYDQRRLREQEFKVLIRCSAGCEILYHKKCWRKISSDLVFKEHMNSKQGSCLTDACTGIIQHSAREKKDEQVCNARKKMSSPSLWDLTSLEVVQEVKVECQNSQTKQKQITGKLKKQQRLNQYKDRYLHEILKIRQQNVSMENVSNETIMERLEFFDQQLIEQKQQIDYVAENNNNKIVFMSSKRVRNREKKLAKKMSLQTFLEYVPTLIPNENKEHLAHFTQLNSTSSSERTNNLKVMNTTELIKAHTKVPPDNITSVQPHETKTRLDHLSSTTANHSKVMNAIEEVEAPEGVPTVNYFGKAKCLICKDREPCVLFRSCYEVVTCQTCCNLVNVCPSCAVPVSQRIVISM